MSKNDNTTNTSLSSRAMLASLSISRWQAALTDKKVTRDVAAQHHVEARRAGRYRKYAIDIKAASFQRVVSAANDLRQTHYWHTLPWGEDGRILTAQNFERYSREIRQKTAVFLDDAVPAFLADFPTLKRNAIRELNGLYNEADYPRDLAQKFSVRRNILPLPDANDFRVKLADADVAAIRAGITDEVQRSIAEAQREPYERLYAHVKRMADTLRDPKAQFRNTLVTGLEDIIDILPALNLTGDPQLETLRDQAATMIENIEAQDLRDSAPVRRKVAKQAAEIQSAMEGFFTPAPTDDTDEEEAA